jgi:hypothetical protein
VDAAAVALCEYPPQYDQETERAGAIIDEPSEPEHNLLQMGRMASVRRKLREAFFFYQKLSEERVIYPENEEVEFYLSAFLSAGLSIIGFFEGKQNRDWFRDWKMGLTDPDKQLLNYMVGQRNLEVHQDGADVIPEFQPVAANANSLRLKKYYFWMDGERSDINNMCVGYLELLVKLMTDFDEHLLEVAQSVWGS